MTFSHLHVGHVAILAMAIGAVLLSMPAVADARTVTVTQNASMHQVRRSGSIVWEEGTATGTFPGSVSARLNATVTTITGTVTFKPRGGGSLTFLVSATPRSIGTIARFSGTMTVSSGTGRFDSARGTFALAGTFNRRSWAATVTAGGRLTY